MVPHNLAYEGLALQKPTVPGSDVMQYPAHAWLLLSTTSDLFGHPLLRSRPLQHNDYGSDRLPRVPMDQDTHVDDVYVSALTWVARAFSEFTNDTGP
jgi:hypothetical protein